MSKPTEPREETKTDWGFGFGSSKTKPKQTEIEKTPVTDCDYIPHVDITSEYYKISDPIKGKALIFNHYSFDTEEQTKREGTNKDCKDLQVLLEHFNFEVDVYKDLKYGELFDVLENTSKSPTLSEYNCLVIAVMSHGDKDKIYAKDHHYSPDTLWTPFNGENCKYLIGKPKVFFIQACRGMMLDQGSVIKSVQTDSKIPDYKIPNMADILVMYSTFIDHYSFRSSINGSWFIQTLIKELSQRADKEDILSILTCVNRTLAFEFQSFVPSNPRFHDQKQVGMIVSSLTKKLYLSTSALENGTK